MSSTRPKLISESMNSQAKDSGEGWKKAPCDTQAQAYVWVLWPRSPETANRAVHQQTWASGAQRSQYPPQEK
jgi:hypothetical protein